MATSTNASYIEDLPLITDEGYQGDSVRLLQRILIFLGHLKAIDATYNSDTITAVKDFQKSNKDEQGNALQVDGQVGKHTWRALMDQIK